MLAPPFLRAKFEAGLSYDRYVGSGRPDQQASWGRLHGTITLTETQRRFLAGFRRRMNVLVTSGIWCGDCAAQVPILDHIARASSVIGLRIVDRDEHSDLSEQVRICGGLRVPTVLFLNEDYEFMAILGDQTLSRLRSKAGRLGEGASCQLPGAGQGQDLTGAMVADWVAEFERVQLLLRLSPKLRDRHGD